MDIYRGYIRGTLLLLLLLPAEEEEIHTCRERGHEVSWCTRGGCPEQGERATAKEKRQKEERESAWDAAGLAKWLIFNDRPANYRTK